MQIMELGRSQHIAEGPITATDIGSTVKRGSAGTEQMKLIRDAYSAGTLELGDPATADIVLQVAKPRVERYTEHIVAAERVLDNGTVMHNGEEVCLAPGALDRRREELAHVINLRYDTLGIIDTAQRTIESME